MIRELNTLYPENEPDYERFEHVGLPCVINRSKSHGSFHLCGYVGIPR